jgi:DNA-directed RNA polymerase specialized sigma24 family protein
MEKMPTKRPDAGKPRKVASSLEVAKALAALSKADLLRLKRIGQLRAAGLASVGWEDLLNEAIGRAIGGERQWPLDVPFIGFLVQTIRSIAHEYRRRAQEERHAHEMRGQPGVNNGSALHPHAQDRVTPERLLIAKDAITRIEALFAEDHFALEVLRGLALGLSPEEIITRMGTTRTRYASAQRRIRRQLAQRRDLMETANVE